MHLPYIGHVLSAKYYAFSGSRDVLQKARQRRAKWRGPGRKNLREVRKKESTAEFHASLGHGLFLATGTIHAS
jgi:hypothetical protein